MKHYLERYLIAQKQYRAFKPKADTRHQSTSISTIRSEIDLSPKPVETLTEMPNVDVIVLDEAQFFGEEIISFCQEAKDQGKMVLVSGLDMDHNRNPFGYMGQLMAIADSVTNSPLSVLVVMMPFIPKK